MTRIDTRSSPRPQSASGSGSTQSTEGTQGTQSAQGTQSTQSTQGTSSSPGAEGVGSVDDACTLDELDTGMSLVRDGVDTARTGRDGRVARGGEAEGQTPIAPANPRQRVPLEETPLVQEIGALEAQCGLELQGDAYEMRALASEVGGADGQCLENAADAMMSSVERAHDAKPGSGLPVLAEGVEAAGEHVKAVSDEKVRESGEGILSRAWSAVKSTSEALADVVRGARPDPAPGETVDIGIQMGASLGLFGIDDRRALSVSRERSPDGGGGDYVVAEERTISASVGPSAGLGVHLQAGDDEVDIKASAGVAGQGAGSIRIEHRFRTKEEADARVRTALLDIAADTSQTLNPATWLTDGPVQDIERARGTASSITASGDLGGALAAELGLEVRRNGKGVSAEAGARAQAKEATSLKVDLDNGKPQRAELTRTWQLEGSVRASLFEKLGGERPETKADVGGDLAMSVSERTVRNLGGEGGAQPTQREIVLKLEQAVDGKRVMAEITVLPGPHADVIGEALRYGDVAVALTMLQSADATMRLESTERSEFPVGLGIDVGVGLRGRGHYGRETSRELGEASGSVWELVGQAWTRGRQALKGDDALEQQLAANQMVR